MDNAQSGSYLLARMTKLVNNTKQQRFKNSAISEPRFLLDFFNFLKNYKWYKDSQYLFLKLWLWEI